MAARAARRTLADEARHRAALAAEHRAEMRRLAGSVTLGEAMAWRRGPSGGCACVGPPDCCMDLAATDRALRAAAHIAVKLIVSRMEALTDG
jgi:hypothetical protein